MNHYFIYEIEIQYFQFVCVIELKIKFNNFVIFFFIFQSESTHIDYNHDVQGDN